MFATEPAIDAVRLPQLKQIDSPEPDYYTPPQDVRLNFNLDPLYTLEQDRTPLSDQQFIGVDWYSTGEPILPEFEFRDSPSKGHLTIYYLLQALDVYSTYYATSNFRCVQEQNPLLPIRPSVEQMLLLKLLPLYALHNDIDHVTNEELAVATGMMGIVVINNYEVIQTAKKQCP